MAVPRMKSGGKVGRMCSKSHIHSVSYTLQHIVTRGHLSHVWKNQKASVTGATSRVIQCCLAHTPPGLSGHDNFYKYLTLYPWSNAVSADVKSVVLQMQLHVGSRAPGTDNMLVCWLRCVPACSGRGPQSSALSSRPVLSGPHKAPPAPQATAYFD